MKVLKGIDMCGNSIDNIGNIYNKDEINEKLQKSSSSNLVIPNVSIKAKDPEYLNNSYTVDSPCTESSSQTVGSPTVIISNGDNSSSYEIPDITVGETYEIFTRKKSTDIKYCLIGRGVSTISEANAHGIKKIQINSYSNKAIDESRLQPWCSHFPLISDYVDDDSVSTEGFRIFRSTSNDYVFLDLFVNETREFATSTTVCENWLKSQNNSGTPLVLIYGISKETSTVTTRPELIPIATLGEYSVSITPEDMYDITVSETLVSLASKINGFTNEISSINETKINTLYGNASVTNASGEICMEDLISDETKAISDKILTVFSNISQYSPESNINTTSLIDGVKEVFNKCIENASKYNPGLSYSNRSKDFFSNFNYIRFPVNGIGSSYKIANLVIEKIPQLTDTTTDYMNYNYKYRISWLDSNANTKVLIVTVTTPSYGGSFTVTSEEGLRTIVYQYE